jgi:hypothetical protein
MAKRFDQLLVGTGRFETSAEVLQLFAGSYFSSALARGNTLPLVVNGGCCAALSDKLSASIPRCNHDVCFTPKSGHVRCTRPRPLRARSGHDATNGNNLFRQSQCAGHDRCIPKWQLSAVGSAALGPLYHCFAPVSTCKYTNKPAPCAKLAREFRLAQMRRGCCTDWVLPTNWRTLACGQMHFIKGAGMTVARY